MAELTSCKACDHQVAKMAKTCPSCGVKNPGMTAADYLFGIGLFIVLVTAVFYFTG